MDTILIHDLEVFFHVGVPDQERSRPQRLLITLELERDIAAAAATDDLRLTTDYHAVAQRVLGFGTNRSWKLIETLAEDLALMALKEFGPLRVTVTVKKFIIPEANFVAVKVTRPR
jgi:dihydroneopterin aldolase